MKASFLELRCKEVINVVDGKRLGHIVDVIFDLQSGQIIGIVLPAGKSLWNVFKSDSEILVPYSQICKIGEDTILVELYSGDNNGLNVNTLQEKKK